MEHIKLKHKFMLHSAVTCKFDNCNNEFTNVYSLRRHILNKHLCSKVEIASSISSKGINDTVIATNDSDFSYATSSILHFDSNNANENRTKIYDMIETNDFKNFEAFNIDEYNSTVFKSALSAIVTMYADMTLSRRT